MHKQNGVIVFTHKMKSCVHELFPCAHFLPRGGELLGGDVGSVTSTTKGKKYFKCVGNEWLFDMLMHNTEVTQAMILLIIYRIWSLRNNVFPGSMLPPSFIH